MWHLPFRVWVGAPTDHYSFSLLRGFQTHHSLHKPIITIKIKAKPDFTFKLPFQQAKSPCAVDPMFLEHDGVWPPRSTHTYSSLCVFTELPFPQGQLYSNALLTDMVNKHAHSPTAFDHTMLTCVVLIQIRSVTQNQSTMCVHRHQLQWQNTKATIWMSFRIHSSSTIMGDEFQKSKVELTKTITTKASNSSKNVWIEKAGES